MTTDDKTLAEHLWEAVAEVRDQHPRVFNDAPTDDVIAAVLPIIRKVKRDAAREALDGLARDCEQIAENVMTEAARNRWDHTAHVIRETLAIEYPEETP